MDKAFAAFVVAGLERGDIAGAVSPVLEWFKSVNLWSSNYHPRFLPVDWVGCDGMKFLDRKTNNLYRDEMILGAVLLLTDYFPCRRGLLSSLADMGKTVPDIVATRQNLVSSELIPARNPATQEDLICWVAETMVSSSAEDQSEQLSSPPKAAKIHDPYKPSADRQSDILAAIENQGTPLTRPELVKAMKLKTEGKLGHQLAWMAARNILIKIPNIAVTGLPTSPYPK